MWGTYLRRTALSVAGVSLVLIGLLALLWNNRPQLDEIDWPKPTVTAAESTDFVTATWLGVSTLLFDDGETQILIDGFFSRPTSADVVLGRSVESEAAHINFVMNEYRMRRLAAIIPVHSHFDHAMDIGAIANRSSASILGSETSANIARGAGVPEDQITVVTDQTPFEFGQFRVSLRETKHGPIGWGGSVPLDGTIDEPLQTPQPISAWRMGGAFTVVIEHPQGTVLVQGSSGYSKYDLRQVSADVVMLGVSQLDSLGKDYADVYWQNVVTASGAHTVYPVHFDDFTRPWGTTELPPRFVDNFVKTSGWLEEFRDRWDRDVSLFMPEFGKPFALFSQPAAEP